MRQAFSKPIHFLKKLRNQAFSSRYLLWTNVAISISLSGVGDGIEQNLEMMSGDLNGWDRRRTLNMSISGCTVGIICHNWYRFLDKRMPGRTIQIVFKKVLVDQVLCSPLCISSFFLTLGYLENKSLDDIMDEVKQKAWRLYAAEWVVWPPAQILNFYILPTKYRVLYDNIISLGYDIYTSRVKYT